MNFTAGFCFEIENVNSEEFKFLHRCTTELEQTGVCGAIGVDSVRSGQTGWVLRPNVIDILGEPPTIEDVIANLTILDDGDGSCNFENLGLMLQKFLELFRPNEVIGFTVARAPSKPVVGGYTGMAFVITRQNFDVHTLEDWLKPVSRNLRQWLESQPELPTYTEEVSND